jgi:facilitated trehalose transporter
VICIFLFVFQQATGIEAVLVYTVFVFDTAGTKMNSNHCTIIVGVLQFCATVACACLVDKAGRRILLMISQLGVGVTMLSLAAYLYVIIGDPTIADRFNWIPLTCLGLFIMSFSIGAGPVPFLMLAELNSAAAIGVASALLTTLNWSFASLITVFFMDIEIQIGLHWCFAGFAACSFLGIGFVFVFVPETKGKSIEEIQSKFRSSTSRKQKQITQF